MTNVNLPIQCISSTVPLVIVVRFLPQAIQAGFPRDGWYMPSGQKEHVLFFVLYEPAGQSAEGAPDKEKKSNINGAFGSCRVFKDILISSLILIFS